MSSLVAQNFLITNRNSGARHNDSVNTASTHVHFKTGHGNDAACRVDFLAARGHDGASRCGPCRLDIVLPQFPLPQFGDLEAIGLAVLVSGRWPANCDAIRGGADA